MKNIKKIGNILLIVASINTIIFLIQLSMNFSNIASMEVSALFGDRNMFARFLTIANSFLLIRYFTRPKKGYFCIEILLFIVIFTCITFLYSRSGYLLYFFATFFIMWKTNNKNLRKYGMIVGVFIFILFSLMTYKRIKMTYMDIKNMTDLSRIAVIKAGINMIKDKPLLGVGYGFSKFRYNEYADKSLPGVEGMTTIHNVFITKFAEQGIVGILFYLLFNFGILFQLLKRGLLKRKIGDIQYELFCFVSLLVYMIHGFVYHSFDSEGFYWIIIAISIIVLRDTKQNQVHATEEYC